MVQLAVVRIAEQHEVIDVGLTTVDPFENVWVWRCFGFRWHPGRA
jgi:hypothetical protein